MFVVQPSWIFRAVVLQMTIYYYVDAASLKGTGSSVPVVSQVTQRQHVTSGLSTKIKSSDKFEAPHLVDKSLVKRLLKSNDIVHLLQSTKATFSIPPNVVKFSTKENHFPSPENVTELDSTPVTPVKLYLESAPKSTQDSEKKVFKVQNYNIITAGDPIQKESNSAMKIDKSKTSSKSFTDVVFLRSKPAKFHEMLKVAQDSENFEDPFSIASFVNGDTNNNKKISTDSSAFSGNTIPSTSRSNSKEETPASKLSTNVTLGSVKLNKDKIVDINNLKLQPSYKSSKEDTNYNSTLTDALSKIKPHNGSVYLIPKDKVEQVNNSENRNLILNNSIVTSTTIDKSYFQNNVTNTLAKLNYEVGDLNNSLSSGQNGYFSENTHIFSHKGGDLKLQLETRESSYNPETRESKSENTNTNNTIPIYEEITGLLHVDTSIDDVQDYDVYTKSTENLEQIFPQMNSSRTNMLEPSLTAVNHKPSFDLALNKNVHSSKQSTPDYKTEIYSGRSHTNYTIDKETFSPSDREHVNTLSLMDNSSLHSSNADNLSATANQNIPNGNIGNQSAKSAPSNVAYSNFVKDTTVLRDRTSDVESGVGGESFNGGNQGTPSQDSDSRDPHLPIFGYNTNWGFSLSNNDTDPIFLTNHYQKVLDTQANRMLQVMNTSAEPCEDFYEYACGKWSRVYPLENKALDNTFDRLREGLDEVLKTLLEEPISAGNSYATKTAKQLYKGCMDEENIEKRGIEPLQVMLQELGGWPALEGESWNETSFDWVKLMAKLRTYNNDILLSEWVAADITNSSYHIIQLDQPDLGLPGREYFISVGDEAYRMAYLDLMLRTCQFLGGDPKTCLEDMLNVLQLEKQLAKILTPAEERRNLSAVNKRLTIDELQMEIPEIDWRAYVSIVAGEADHRVEEVIVFAIKYIKKLVTMVANTKKRTISNYLLWRFIKNRISNLGHEALEAKQEFINVLFGSKSQPERWLSCVSYVNGNLGYVVGSMFVKRYYPQSSKIDSEEMIQLIRESFIDAIRNATWMAESTRKVAVEKVLAMVRNVGYPEHILNDQYMDSVYSDLKFNESEHFWNVIQMLQFHARSSHKLLQKPVNRTDWTTTPAVVNAYYSRSKNMIMFPAGILQPPFYHPAFPRSLNFGGIGVVIGHEISHGFDDRGRQFDEKGNLHQWWTEEDVSQFYDRAACMLDQYGEYMVSSVGLRINAVNTLGENIADNAGLKIAYEAYQRWKKLNGEEQYEMRKLNLTKDQLFFLNFGQIWCEVNSPEAMLTKIRGGQHSPNKYRVIGTLSNSEEFIEAFHCPKGSKMNRDEKCKVW